MTSSSAIPWFHEIDDLYAAAGLGRTPVSPDFDIIALKVDSRKRDNSTPVGPHRRGFFQFTYSISGRDGDDSLLAAAPEQVLTGVHYLRPAFEHQRGYTLLFKSSVVAHQLAAPANEFPFFCQPASVALPVPAKIRKGLLRQFEVILTAANEGSPYRTKRLSGSIASLLYDVRWIYEQAEAGAGQHRLCSQLSCRFDEVVLQHFQTHHTVEDYARLMHVSSDYLSAEVKAKTGRNARDIIADRLIEEAKHQLTYTALTVSEIADQLGFIEPTHFTRYFKRHVQQSPQAFRNSVLGVTAAVASPEVGKKRQTAAV